MTAAAIDSRALIQALIDKEIIPQREVRRVIIDAEVGDVVRIHVECFGAKDLLDVITPTNISKTAELTILETDEAEELDTEAVKEHLQNEYLHNR
jgi:hypothetical protein